MTPPPPTASTAPRSPPRERLAAADPGNAESNDLGISHDRLGELAVTAGDTATAHREYRAALAIRERLAAADPGNAGYQRDLALSGDRVRTFDSDATA